MPTRWFSKTPSENAPQAPFPSLTPDQPFYAIGDIHGRADLLEKLLTHLDLTHPVVCVGDYVDRGENSKAVLDLLAEHPEFICLMGNHEDMMLKFLDDPETTGRRWLRYGGLQTLASFGIHSIRETADASQLKEAAAGLAEMLGPKQISWLRTLKLSHASGNLLVTHAGANPHRPTDDQQRQDLLWGHEDFETIPRSDPIWIIHGHTIVPEPHAISGRIAIDTGAYATGVLTAALIRDGGGEFLTT